MASDPTTISATPSSLMGSGFCPRMMYVLGIRNTGVKARNGMHIESGEICSARK